MRFKKLAAIAVFALFFLVSAGKVSASEVQPPNIPVPNISVQVGSAENPAQVSESLQLLFVVSILAVAPSLILMLTCFTRIIIILHFVRAALGTQQMPPNQVLIGISLFLTLFVMAQPIADIYNNALIPYSSSEITQEEAISAAMDPIRGFMLRQVEPEDLALFAGIKGETLVDVETVSNTVLIPAFILGEISKGFIYGFVIYMPFIVIDMVVASTLMAMGMMMLPPAMISLPFKILLFVMVNGWSRVVESIILGFR